ncbi:HNH endonuclease signature motif containing protein [Streptomyces sp. NBC_01506]|uniref:HNH endonuclease signature motif containing protein n=1 Tax=Streptomyces sp. NBC_01506 TaxID=2903887 RepID=UPI00386CC693
MSGGGRYSRARLVEAAERCVDVDEVIAFFGTRPYGHLRRYLLRRFAHFGIDVSHFRRPGDIRRGEARPDPARLGEAVRRSRSVAETLRRLGIPDNGRQRARLRGWLADDGLDTSHFLGQAHRRGKGSPTPARSPEDILVKHRGKTRTRTVLLRRALLETGVELRCVGCGTGPEWNGQPMTLEIDHINGDLSDDRAENLRLLCPNCHAVTATWCRGGGRRSSYSSAEGVRGM